MIIWRPKYGNKKIQEENKKQQIKRITFSFRITKYDMGKNNYIYNIYVYLYTLYILI